MNKKKISKILSATLSIVYITNSTPVFAQDIEINTEIIKDEVNKTENSEVLNEEEEFLDNKEDDNEVDKIENTDEANINDNEHIDAEDTLVDEKPSIDDESYINENLSIENNVEQNNQNVSLENTNETDIKDENKDIAVLADTIDFKDENLLKAINKSLSRAEDTPITIAELESITNLNLSSSNITDLSGLEHATALANLNISDNNIVSLKAISQLTSLNVLDISNNKGFITVNEFKSMSNLSNLEQIKVPIMDENTDLILDASSDFANIKVLDLSGSSIGNIEVSNIKNLEYLIVNNSIAKDIVLTNITCDKKDNYAFCISIKKTNANKFHMYNSNIKSSIELDESSIDNVVFEDNYIYNHINLQRGIYGSVFMNNIYETGYMNFTDSSMSNIDLKNMPNLTSIYMGNLKAPEFNLSNLELVNMIYATGAKIDKVWIHDMPVLNYIYLDKSNCKNIFLDNLPILSYVTCSNSKGCIELTINNCIKISSFYVDDAQIKTINVTNAFSDSSFYGTFQRSEIDSIYIVNSNMGSIYCDYSKINNVIVENCPTVSYSYFSASSTTVNSIILKNTSYQRLEIYKSQINNFYMDNGGEILTHINLSKTAFDNVCILNAPNVNYVDALETKVKNISLGGFNELNSLNLSNTGLQSINLIGFEKMQTVNLDNNVLENIDCLGKISSLETITASNNSINSVEQLQNLTTLKNVNLDNNKIKDISHLANNADLQIANVSVLNQNVDLEEVYSKGGIVSIDYPNIIDIDGTKTPVIAVSNNGAIGKDFIAWKYDNDGILTEQIETSSINNNFTVIANQKIVIDNVAPELNVSLDKTEFTNKNIIATVIASDELTGLDSICLPDGSIIKTDTVKASEDSEIAFNITKNGEYTFVAKDKVGNTTEKTITVSNIDKEKPVVTIDKVKELSNKKQFVVSINAKDNLSGIKSITLPDCTVLSSENASYTFTVNGDYVVQVEDYAGNITIESIEVKNLSVDDDKINNNSNNNSIDNGGSNNSVNTNIPNTGGLAGVISVTSALSTVCGLFVINKKRFK